MSIDKRVYVVTSIAAVVLGGAITLAVPRTSLEEIANRNAGNGIVYRADAQPRLALSPGGEGGVGVRKPAAADVGIVR